MKAIRVIFVTAILFCMLTTGIAQATGSYMVYGAPAYAYVQPYQEHVFYQPYPFYQRMNPNDIVNAANQSTDPAKVIDAYILPVGDKNVRRINHIDAGKLRGREAYAAYVNLANSFGGDFLASYKAGEEARKLGDSAGARAWYERALYINPYYKPASDALGRLR